MDRFQIKHTLARLRTRAKWPLCHRIELFFRGSGHVDPKNNIIISGLPRGGTTWIAEVMETISDSLLLWEPLNVFTLAETTDLEFSWRQYIPEHAQWPEAFFFFSELFHGKRIHPLYFRKWDFPLKAKRRLLIKFCRANRLLPWLVTNFRLKPPVYLVRHPCAVVSSQLRYGAWTQIKPSVMFSDHTRYGKEFYEPYRRILARLSSTEELLTALWCLDNIIPLRHRDNNIKWTTVSYEGLLLRGEEELRRIFKRLEIEIPLKTMHRLSHPSSETKHGSPLLCGGDQLSGWRSHLNSEQIAMILHTLEDFEMTDIYDDGLEPKYERLHSTFG